jgi:hypothetical protein
MVNIPTTKDKILCSVLYSSYFIPLMTFVPIIWIIVSNIRKIYQKDFVKYHCYQAVLLNMIIFFLPSFFSLLISFLSNFLGIFTIFENSISLLGYLSQTLLQAYNLLAQVLTIYAIIWTLRGKYTYIPKISQAINYLLR